VSPSTSICMPDSDLERVEIDLAEVGIRNEFVAASFPDDLRGAAGARERAGEAGVERVGEEHLSGGLGLGLPLRREHGAVGAPLDAALRIPGALPVPHQHHPLRLPQRRERRTRVGTRGALHLAHARAADGGGGSASKALPASAGRHRRRGRGRGEEDHVWRRVGPERGVVWFALSFPRRFAKCAPDRCCRKRRATPFVVGLIKSSSVSDWRETVIKRRR
jgi:hypothetical protein